MIDMFAQPIGTQHKAAGPEGAGIETLDRLGVVGGLGQYGEREIGHAQRGIASGERAVHRRTIGSGPDHHRQVTMTGWLSSTSAIRRRVPVVVSGGSLLASKKPQAMISRFGSGIRSWRNWLIT
jgi:hypothetical protein